MAQYASKYYDPVKAHEYYERTKKLKGRKKSSTAGLNEEGKNAAGSVKEQMTSERKSRVENHKKAIQARITSLRNKLKKMTSEERKANRAEIMGTIQQLRADHAEYKNKLKQEYDNEYELELTKIKDDTSFRKEVARNSTAGLNEEGKSLAKAAKEKITNERKTAIEKHKSDMASQIESARSDLKKYVADRQSRIKTYSEQTKSKISKIREQIKGMSKEEREKKSASLYKQIEQLQTSNKEKAASLRNENSKQRESIKNSCASIREENKKKREQTKADYNEKYLQELDKLKANRKYSAWY